MNPEYMVLKPEQMYDPNYGYYGYQQTPLNVNVNLAAYPTETNVKQLTSKDSDASKVSAGTASTITPKTGEVGQNGEDKNPPTDSKQKRDGQSSSEPENKESNPEDTSTSDSKDVIVPKQEMVMPVQPEMG